MTNFFAMAKDDFDVCTTTWDDADFLEWSPNVSFHEDNSAPASQLLPGVRDIDLSAEPVNGSSPSTDSGMSSVAACPADFMGDVDYEPVSQETIDDDDLDSLALAASLHTWDHGQRLRVLCLQPPQSLRKEIQAIVGLWVQHANIEFVFVDSPPAEIRISFDASAGSYSKIGRLALSVTNQSQPTMNLAVDARTSKRQLKRTVLHEFGHVLGLIHEHSRPDAGIPWNKPVVYDEYYYGCGWSRRETDKQVLGKYDKKKISRYSSTYDPLSIMIYPIPARHLTDPSFEVKWNTELSVLDKTFIQKLYPVVPINGAGLSPVSTQMASPVAVPQTMVMRGSSAGQTLLAAQMQSSRMGKSCKDWRCPYERPCRECLERINIAAAKLSQPSGQWA